MTTIILSGKGRSGALPSWRDDLMPASFRNARFHCEVNSRENGRRIVVHQFPKKEWPYAEDMGREAMQFIVRAYCIVFPRDEEPELYRRDYRLARDTLIKALEQEGPGTLRLPTLGSFVVVCTRYRVTEEEKLGGYCVFDITFAEQGLDPQRWVPILDTQGILQNQAEAMRQQTMSRWKGRFHEPYRRSRSGRDRRAHAGKSS